MNRTVGAAPLATLAVPPRSALLVVLLLCAAQVQVLAQSLPTRSLSENSQLSTAEAALRATSPGGWWEVPSHREPASVQNSTRPVRAWSFPEPSHHRLPSTPVPVDDSPGPTHLPIDAPQLFDHQIFDTEPPGWIGDDGHCQDSCLGWLCQPIGCYLEEYSCRYASAEVLGWWGKGMDVPPLVTTSPAGTARDDIGVLGTAGASVLFGNAGINSDGRVGGRFILGAASPANCRGFEAVYTFLEDETTNFTASSADTPRLARPFFNTITGLSDAVQLAVPGELDGAISIRSTSRFQMFDARYRACVFQRPCDALDLLLGYRYAELKDDLLIADSITTLVGFPPTAPVIAAGTNLSGIDQFASTNRFHGGQIGLVYEATRCGCSWEFLANIAFGSTTSEVFIDGRTLITVPGDVPETQPGNKLALPSNMGRFRQSEFSVVPEIGLRWNCDFKPCWRASVGYTLMYWTHVARAGNQIDLNVDPNQFPSPAIPPGTGLFPQFRFQDENFWVQGIGLRLEHSF